MSDSFSDSISDVYARAEKAREVNAQLLELREEGCSPDGTVRVVVDATGRLMSLEIEDEALSSSGAQLASLVMETVANAQRECAARAADLAGQAWGQDSMTAQVIADQAYGQVVEPPSNNDDDDKPRRGATRLW